MAELDPWGSSTVASYDKVFREFGLTSFPEKLLLDHYLFERKIIVAHRDFERVHERISKIKPFVNITGIASSGQLHFGHKVDIDLFLFFKKCGARNYFCISDLDAYLSRPDKRVPSIEKAKEFEKEIYIIGGSGIFREGIEFADKMYLSFIKKEYEGDTFFPEFDEKEWNIARKEEHKEFEFVEYVRKEQA